MGLMKLSQADLKARNVINRSVYTTGLLVKCLKYLFERS
jgi:hypothetical protein